MEDNSAWHCLAVQFCQSPQHTSGHREGGKACCAEGEKDKYSVVPTACKQHVTFLYCFSRGATEVHLALVFIRSLSIGVLTNMGIRALPLKSEEAEVY